MKKFLLRTFVALELVLLAIAGIAYFASRQETMELVGEKLIKPQGIEYAKVKGSLYEGMTFYDVTLAPGVSARKLAVRYHLPSLMLGTPEIDEVTVEGLRVVTAQLQKGGGDEPEWGIPPFAVGKVRVKEARIESDVNVTLELAAEKMRFDGAALQVKQVEGGAKSPFGDVTLAGAIKANVFRGRGEMLPSRRTRAYYAPYLAQAPERFDVEVERADLQGIRLRTHFETLAYAGGGVRAEKVGVAAAYVYGADALDLELDYRLCAEAGCGSVAQSLRLFFDGVYQGSLDATRLALTHKLPFEALHAEYSGDAQRLRVQAQAGTLNATLKSNDYRTYAVALTGTQLPLPPELELPGALADYRADVALSGVVQTGEEVAFGGDVNVSMAQTTLSGRVDYAEGALLMALRLDVAPESPLQKAMGAVKTGPLQLVVALAEHKAAAMATGAGLDVTVLKEGETLKGWGTLHNAALELEGTVEEGERADAAVRVHVPSLYAFADALRPLQVESYEFYDAQLDVAAQLTYDGAFSARGELSIPWYALVFDSKSRFYGVGSSARFAYEGRSVTLEQYSIDVVNRRIHASQPSYLRVDENLTLRLEPLRVLDRLEVSGTVTAQGAQLRLLGKDVRYSGLEGEARFDADAVLDVVFGAEERLEGRVVLHEARISYVPVNDVIVSDDDIIIIQEVRPPSTTRRFINLQFVSDAPLRYKTPQVDVWFTPEVTLWREPGTPSGLLGMVSVNKGEFRSGTKSFAIKPSHLYFGGESPINPYLELYVDYALEELLFHIYITHTLESPVFVFSSEPAMGQNDIMSYILFGQPADTMFGTTGGESRSVAAANLLLGTGLKEMIGDTTGVKLDTINLLSSPEGELGFEVGAKLHKDLRIVYRNDAVSNFMLQYRLNRWLRLDVEVYETGQGVNLLYIKEFEAFERD